MNDIRSNLEDALSEVLNESTLANVKGQLSKAMDEALEGFEYSIKTDLAYNLARMTERQAEEAIKAMFEGNEDQMRQHLSCQAGRYTGRDTNHSVIHGRLFETGALELRKKVVDAFPELLKNERILDLEDQVKSLVSQVRTLEAKNEDLRRATYA